MDAPPLAYCGPAPVPGELPRSWNLDPVLLAGWVALALAGELVLRRRVGSPRGRRAALHAGWALALAAWISPLCALGVALFSARVGQHALLTLAAAPLLAWGLRLHDRAAVRARHALAAGAAFAAATWFWHAPPPYEATFRSDAAYWAMHATLLASAVWLWRILLHRGVPALPCALAVASCFQMSLLGALFVFARAPLFEAHRVSALAWGLSPLQDQQLGGLLLWVPGCVVFLLAALAPVASWLRVQGEPLRSPAL